VQDRTTLEHLEFELLVVSEPLGTEVTSWGFRIWVARVFGKMAVEHLGGEESRLARVAGE